jgi:alcohol dehydrogenase
MNILNQAQTLLKDFKGKNYVYGEGVLPKVGSIAKKIGRKAVLIREIFPGSDAYVETIKQALTDSGVELVRIEIGAQPNAPREDLSRITQAITEADADVIISFGGGSTIDAVKAAEVLHTLGGTIEDYFGMNMVTDALAKSRKTLIPHIAIETVASSGAHLTKYSNITDIATGQKKLIVDEAIIPAYPMFDYAVTYNMPAALTMDGALDGIAHSLEVLYGAHGQSFYEKAKEIAKVTISLVVENLPKVIEHPKDIAARDALCLATDLGGYAIMVGGTNGGHLTSFSLVDVLSHGRACAIMNPYYTVFFASAVEDGLRMVGSIFKRYGYSNADFDHLSGKELGFAGAEAMFKLSEAIGFPTTLGEVEGFTDGHIERALIAAKNPQLEMKLKNMPIPLTPQTIDTYMAPILESAKTGDLSLIKYVD